LAAALEGPSLIPVLVASVLALSLLFAYLVRRRSAVAPATATADESMGFVSMPLSKVPSVAERRTPGPPEADQQEGRAAALGPPRESDVAEETDQLAQADLFLGFGRYREAEQLVRAALQREPGRSELKVKLAEIYHGAGNATAFAAVLEELEAEQEVPLPPRTVDRLLAMAEGLGLDLAAARSLALAQESIPAPLATSLPPLGSPMEALGRGAERAATAGSPLPMLEAAGIQGRGSEGLDAGLALDLNAALAEIEQAERGHAGLPPTTPREPRGPHLHEGLSLEPLSEVLKPGATAEPPPPGTQPGHWVATPSAAPPDPEARRRAMREETNLIKLDLARAYLAMDDLANARALLEEIVGEGEGAAREAAEALLATLG
jgi:pilus assembly protein FimV